MRTRVSGWLLAAALVVHLLALYLPGSPDPGPDVVPHLDKLVHVLLFATPALLICRITSKWWPIVAMAAHAPVSELVQYRLVPHRSGDVWDLVADAVGVILGLGLASLTARRDAGASPKLGLPYGEGLEQPR